MYRSNILRFYNSYVKIRIPSSLDWSQHLKDSTVHAKQEHSLIACIFMYGMYCTPCLNKRSLVVERIIILSLVFSEVNYICCLATLEAIESKLKNLNNEDTKRNPFLARIARCMQRRVCWNKQNTRTHCRVQTSCEQTIQATINPSW